MRVAAPATVDAFRPPGEGQSLLVRLPADADLESWRRALHLRCSAIPGAWRAQVLMSETGIPYFVIAELRSHAAKLLGLP